MAFPSPNTHAVPDPQPLVPNPGWVMKELGCVCFLRPMTKAKLTRKPSTVRNNVACVILGTNLGHKNNGAAALTVSKNSVALTDRLA